MTHRFRPSPTLRLPCNIHTGCRKWQWKRLVQWDSFQIWAQRLPWEIFHMAFAWGLYKEEWRRSWLEKSPNSARSGFALKILFSIWNTSLNWIGFPLPFVFLSLQTLSSNWAELQTVTKRMVSNFILGGVEGHPGEMKPAHSWVFWWFLFEVYNEDYKL